MDIVDYAFGVADGCGCPPFQERGTEGGFYYWGITLLSLLGKVYNRLLERRVCLLEHLIQEEQCGFRPYTLVRVLEGA